MMGWVVALAVAQATAAPFQVDSIGPIHDVTASWRAYQPANVFCVKPDVTEYTPEGTGPTVTGADPACRQSGFRAATTGLVLIRVRTPTLCPGCRRLFVDFSKIQPGSAYAHGHVFYRLTSPNFTYTLDPIAHSPNTKNFSNDKFVVPDGSPQQPIVYAGDLHQFAGYTSDTAHFVHNVIQGPYYTGPWYVNRQGQRINGVYLDVDTADATHFPGGAQANDIGYAAGFNSGTSCPSDADFLYGSCVDGWGFSVSTVDPFSPLPRGEPAATAEPASHPHKRRHRHRTQKPHRATRRHRR